MFYEHQFIIVHYYQRISAVLINRIFNQIDAET